MDFLIFFLIYWVRLIRDFFRAALQNDVGICADMATSLNGRLPDIGIHETKAARLPTRRPTFAGTVVILERQSKLPIRIEACYAHFELTNYQPLFR